MKSLKIIIVIFSVYLYLASCIQPTHILSDYQHLVYTPYNISASTYNSIIQCLAKCSLNQNCVSINYNQNICILFGDKYISITHNRNTFIKFESYTNAKIFNGTSYCKYFYSIFIKFLLFYFYFQIILKTAMICTSTKT